MFFVFLFCSSLTFINCKIGRFDVLLKNLKHIMRLRILFWILIPMSVNQFSSELREYGWPLSNLILSNELMILFEKMTNCSMLMFVLYQQSFLKSIIFRRFFFSSLHSFENVIMTWVQTISIFKIHKKSANLRWNYWKRMSRLPLMWTNPK